MALASRRALISVSDKSELMPCAKALQECGYDLVSTGSTGEALREAGFTVHSVAEVSGYPEILGGRVKTLHPAIFGGILADETEAQHLQDVATHGIVPIDVVVCNLYPFEKVALAGADWATLIENIDIGGVSLLRAAAKNHNRVLVLCDPADYGPALALLADGLQGKVGSGELLALRQRMALKAFAATAAYDALIVRTLSEVVANAGAGPAAGAAGGGAETGNSDSFVSLRYGENPHQSARVVRRDRMAEFLRSDAARRRGGELDLTAVCQLAGKELSYNNYLDLEHGVRLLGELPPQSCAILKHNTPCGVGVVGKGWSNFASKGSSIQSMPSISAEAFSRAFASDTVSPFGGVVLFNVPVDAPCARRLSDVFLEVILAPKFEADALEILRAKKNLRLIELDVLRGSLEALQLTQIQGGFLIQDADRLDDSSGWALASGSAASLDDAWHAACRLAWAVVKNVRSNAIVLANPDQTLAVAGGFTNRVDAVRRCLELLAGGAFSREPFVLASDGFFPFADSIDLLRGYPVRAIVQPGGSVRDAEVISACADLAVPLYLTGVRHFKH
jgi:phosphoribosylaminoimidazolecarboxamide formyltransferase/IMP cyclohydrolase